MFWQDITCSDGITRQLEWTSGVEPSPATDNSFYDNEPAPRQRLKVPWRSLNRGKSEHVPITVNARRSNH